MRMTGTGDVFRRRTELDCERDLSNQGAGVGADNMRAEHAVRVRVFQNLHKAVGRLVDLGATIGREREFAGAVLHARFLQFLLGLSGRGDFRIRIDHARDRVVIHMAGLTGEDFRHRNAFIFGLVREHRPRDDVADGKDALHIRLEMLVDDNALLLVKLDAGLREAEPVRVGHASDGDEDDIGFEHLALTAGGGFNRRLERLALRVDARDLRAEAEFDALLFLDALELAHDLAVPVQTERGQVAPLRCLVLLAGLHPVQVLHPHEERAALRTGVQPRHQGGAQVAEVEVAGGAGGEAAGGHAVTTVGAGPVAGCDGRSRRSAGWRTPPTRSEASTPRLPG